MNSTQKRKKTRLKRGFTLLEIFLSLGIVGTALVAIAGAVQVSGRRVRSARKLLRASRIANAKMNHALQTIDPSELERSGVDPDLPEFRWELEVEEGELYEFEDFNLGDKTWVIRVQVRWDNGKKSFSATARRLKNLTGARGGR